MSQREAEADGDLRQQAAEALAAANGALLPTADSVDDLDTDTLNSSLRAKSDGGLTITPRTTEVSLSSRTRLDAPAYSAVSADEPAETSSAANGNCLTEPASGLRKQNSNLNSVNRGAPAQANKACEKKSALKNSGTGSMRAANLDGLGERDEQQRGTRKGGKRCCVVS